MYLLDTLLPLVLAIVSLAVVAITYLRWALERVQGNQPLPLLSRFLRRIFRRGG